MRKTNCTETSSSTQQLNSDRSLQSSENFTQWELTLGKAKKTKTRYLLSYIRIRMGVFSLLLVGICSEAPGWGVDETYEDMMRAFGNFKPPFKQIDSMIGG